MPDLLSDEKIMRIYKALLPEYQSKVQKYLVDIRKLQRMEQHVLGTIHSIEWKRKRSTQGQDGVYCSFCGAYQDDVGHIIAGPHAYICDECARLCGEILDEVETEETNGDETPAAKEKGEDNQ